MATSIYHKPVRLLMRDLVETHGLDFDSIVTRDTVLRWFQKEYSKVSPRTVEAHLVRMSTNAPARLNHNPKPPEDDLFYKIDSQRFRLFNPESDPIPIRRTQSVAETDTEEDDLIDSEDFIRSREFAYEADLKNYLAKNLEIIEPGLSLYNDGEISGIEYPVGGRYIDLLAIDSSKDYVVIELKVSRGYDRVIGQLLRYTEWIKQNLSSNQQSVRGMIIARDISEDLKLACKSLSHVELFEYELSLSLKSVDK